MTDQECQVKIDEAVAKEHAVLLDAKQKHNAYRDDADPKIECQRDKAIAARYAKEVDTLRTAVDKSATDLKAANEALAVWKQQAQEQFSTLQAALEAEKQASAAD